LYSVVGVRFKKAGKIYYFDPLDFPIERDQYVIVETARGVEYGKVVVGKKEVEESDVVLPLKKVMRIAGETDARVVEENKGAAKEAFTTCLNKIRDHGLKMKLVDVEFTFDRNKIIFYFTAEGRVDFRELVKDLASIFRTRIELRQIGVRDEAKMLGGLGPCGRVLCCSSWLGDFEPVSIKMAKDQNLSLNPTKISGLCGRLMCCLKFEHLMPEAVRFMYSCLKWAKLRNFQWMMLSSSKPYKVTFGVETWRKKIYLHTCRIWKHRWKRCAPILENGNRR